MNWQAILLTLKLASLVSVALLVLGLPLAYWLAFSRFRFKFLVEALTALPLVLPPTVLGFYMLLLLGSRNPLLHSFRPLAFTFTGLFIASVLYSFPFAVQPFAASFGSVDRKLLAASSILGASRLHTFLRIVLPLSLTGILTGVVLSFAHTVGEFGVVLMVGGNIPGVTRTVSIDIYDDVQGLNYAAANQTSLVLLGFSFLTLCVIYAVNRQLLRSWFSGQPK